MSISTTTDRLAPPRRVQPRHLVGALLLAIGLIAAVAAIAISTTTTNASHPGARPATTTVTQPHPPAQPTGAPVSSASGATFRDPITHALITTGTPPAPQAEPGPGHR